MNSVSPVQEAYNDEESVPISPIQDRLRPRSLRRPSIAAERGNRIRSKSPTPSKVTWSSLPKKRQLAILTLARLSEPLSATSASAYVFHQLEFFNPDLSASAISRRVGILSASFTGAQAVTAVHWGRFADSKWGGRKRVLLVGLTGSAIGNLGYGFAEDYGTAIVFRVFAGVLNGNIGVMRTMISEIVKEKKYQSRAFLLLPACFNIGTLIGPVLGGFLADPVTNYPGLLGPGSALGGENGVQWLKRWPYALPNILSAGFLFGAALLVFLNLEETLEILKEKPDRGLRLGSWLATIARRLLHPKSNYKSLQNSGPDHPSRSTHHEARTSRDPPKPRQKLPFRRIWTTNVITTLTCSFLLAMSVGTFHNLWFIFLSAPRANPEKHPQQLPFQFTGGLGLPSSKVGAAMAILGAIGIFFQLILYPAVATRLGTLLSFRCALLIFPVVYLLTPYLTVIPSSSGPTDPASGFLVWFAISTVLCIMVLARTFALPANIILINNCSPHPSVLGTVHGVAQSVSSVARTVGPVAGSALFGLGYDIGVVSLAYWALAGVAITGFIVSGWVREGDGHEIILQGEEVDDISDVEEDDDTAPITLVDNEREGRITNEQTPLLGRRS